MKCSLSFYLVYPLTAKGYHDLSEFATLSKELGTPLPTNQLPYNLIWRSIEVDVVPVCEAEEVGILAYTPLMAGLLSGKYTDAASVPEGRQRTKHFNSARTDRCYHGGPGAEEETFRSVSLCIAGVRTCCVEH